MKKILALCLMLVLLMGILAIPAEAASHDYGRSEAYNKIVSMIAVDGEQTETGFAATYDNKYAEVPHYKLVWSQSSTPGAGDEHIVCAIEEEDVCVSLTVTKKRDAVFTYPLSVYTIDAEGNEVVLAAASIDPTVYTGANAVFASYEGEEQYKEVLNEKLPYMVDIFRNAVYLVKYNGGYCSAKSFGFYEYKACRLHVLMATSSGVRCAICEHDVFTDVKSDKYYSEPVIWAYNNGITSGVSEGIFAPKDICTRAQLVTFLWRNAGSPEPAEIETGFEDVPTDKYYAKAVAWAVENGIAYGKGENSFAPNDPCTRAQFVTFLWRANGSEEPTVENTFTDVDPEKWYAQAVMWAAHNGITTGVGNNCFAPNDNCTRAQAVTFLYNMQE